LQATTFNQIQKRTNLFKCIACSKSNGNNTFSAKFSRYPTRVW